MRTRSAARAGTKGKRGISGTATVVGTSCAILATVVVAATGAHEAHGAVPGLVRGSSTRVVRAGFLIPSGSLRIAALGDSVPRGKQTTSYVNLTAGALERAGRERVFVSNESFDGAKSADVKSAINSPGSPSSKVVGTADITIIEVGANDFDETRAHDSKCAPVQTSGCYTSDMKQMTSNVRDIVQAVKRRAKPGAQIVLVGYWNNFKDAAAGQAIGQNYVAQGRSLAEWTNSSLSTVAEQEGVAYADTYTPFFAPGRDVTKVLQPDGDHPNEAGHRLIADAVLEALGSAARV